ncbi:hypothetical protein T4A_14325 [Trichinella pseudospiralis]|uniref:Uncharacterized protein n=1 Tax=Trichinella pseudospiralis TaxID=6337 RepID=A0A0V1C3Z6_TRIPS|nr:hypothetical protein T4A_14325 [Trichinella pseudospiralis]
MSRNRHSFLRQLHGSFHQHNQHNQTSAVCDEIQSHSANNVTRGVATVRQ